MRGRNEDVDEAVFVSRLDGDDPKEKFKELLGSVKVETVVVRAPDPPAVADFPKVTAEVAVEFAVVIDGSTAAATVVVGVDDDAWKLNFDAIRLP